jgi:hypothetical protein
VGTKNKAGQLVFVQVIDPVGQGFIAGMAYPGGNVTASAFSKIRWAASGSRYSKKSPPTSREWQLWPILIPLP